MDKILLIEDDISLGQSMVELLEKENFSVTRAYDLKEANTKSFQDFNLILLDWMLPDGQGIDFLKSFRDKGFSIPVIMLTARADLIDKVLGLEGGANDYITKPFETRELIARIRVQLRGVSSQISEARPKVSLGDLIIDQEQRTCSYKGDEVILTKMEFDLLYLLASNPKKTFSREKLLDIVWGLENYPTTRTVDTHVLQLRQKLTSELIETVRGIGYRFALL